MKASIGCLHLQIDSICLGHTLAKKTGRLQRVSDLSHESEYLPVLSYNVLLNFGLYTFKLSKTLHSLPRIKLIN